MRPKPFAVTKLSERLQVLIEAAHRAGHVVADGPLENGVTDLTRMLGLSRGYLSGRNKTGSLPECVERAIFLRLGFGPSDEQIASDPVNCWGPARRQFRKSEPREFALALENQPLHPRPLSHPLVVQALEDIARDVKPRQKREPLMVAEPAPRPKRARLPPKFPMTNRLAVAFGYVLGLTNKYKVGRMNGAHVISHLMQVAGIVIENHGDEDLAIAAFLHDAVEDNGGSKTLAEIEAKFGSRVAKLVQECSDSSPEDPQDREEWLPRKKAFLRAMSDKSDDALRVILADKLHNARAMYREARLNRDWWDHLDRTVEEQVAYFVVAYRVLSRYYPSPLTSELALMIAILENSFCDPMKLDKKIKFLSQGIEWS